MAKDLKCPVNAHRHIVGDVRTFRLPAQTKKLFTHEPTDSRRNPRRGSRLWRRAFVLGRVCTLSRIDVQSCARNRESRAPAHRFSSRHEFLVGAFGSMTAYLQKWNRRDDLLVRGRQLLAHSFYYGDRTRMCGSGPIAAVESVRGSSTRPSTGALDLGLKEDPKAVFERPKLEPRAEGLDGGSEAAGNSTLNRSTPRCPPWPSRPRARRRSPWRAQPRRQSAPTTFALTACGFRRRHARRSRWPCTS
jgi:hypothetical protein